MIEHLAWLWFLGFYDVLTRKQLYVPNKLTLWLDGDDPNIFNQAVLSLITECTFMCFCGLPNGYNNAGFSSSYSKFLLKS